MKTLRRIVHAIQWIGKEFSQKTLSVHSAHVVFFIMVSFFPFVMFFFTLLQHTPLAESNIIHIFESILPKNISDILTSWINEAYHKSSGTLLSISVIATLWSGSKGFIGITYGLDKIYGVTKHRNWFLKRIYSLFYTLAFSVILLISLLVLVYGNKILLAIDSFFSIDTPWFIGIISLRSVLGFGIFFLFFLLLYSFVPSPKVRARTAHLSGSTKPNSPRTKEAVPGALFTSVLWIVFSYLFSLYVDHFSSFSSIYGSLTYIVVIMLWLYFCINLLFLGALLNCYLAETSIPSK